MSATTEVLGNTSAGYPQATPATAATGAQRIRGLLLSIKAACVASHMGQAYYHLSDEQLAELGMTRSDIPARLASVMDDISQS